MVTARGMKTPRIISLAYIAFRVRKWARNRTTKIFTSSVTWKAKKPTFSHREAPPTRTPILGMRTRVRRTREMITPG